MVREWINTRLRAMVRAGRDVVVDGRDIGTVVFPDAELKIFLTATPRGPRRPPDQPAGQPGGPGRLEAEAAALAARDQADSTRAVAPLKRRAGRRPPRYHRDGASPSRSASSWSWPARSSAPAEPAGELAP